MRLIETSTHQVEEFVGEIPDYAILSHTWNPNEPEVTLADMAGNGIRDLRNSKFNKIRDVCKKAKEVGLKYCWVDTCCIDKSSSAELSESINSMYRWYQNSAICYVFLFDLKPPQTLDAQLHLCRWFTRGWTLQELLAPSILVFFDSAWHPRGSIRLRPSEHWPSQYHGSDYTTDLSGRVSSITGIPSKALAGTSSLRIMRAAEIMSWASGRETTRPEDMAYSLLGLFDVNMPLLYGEGNKAFARLQEEIVVRRGDLSLLAWSPPDNSVDTCSALAVSPASFSWCRGYHVVQRRGLNVEVGITNRGLRLGVRLLKRLLPETRDETPPQRTRRTRVRPNSTYFLDLQLSLEPHLIKGSRGEYANWYRPLAVNGPPAEPLYVGIHLRKCGPSLYYRDLESIQGLLVKKSQTLLITRRHSTQTYLVIDTSVENLAMDHQLAQELMHHHLFRGPAMIPGRTKVSTTLDFYHACKMLDLRIVQQKTIELFHPRIGSLWDVADLSFISTASEHLGWDAMQVVARGPAGRGDMTVMLFIFMSEYSGMTPPTVVLMPLGRELQDELPSLVQDDREGVLLRYPPLRQLYNLARHDATKYGGTLHQKTQDLRQIHRGADEDNVRNYYSSLQKVFEAPFRSKAMRVQSEDGQWTVEAEISMTLAPPEVSEILGAGIKATQFGKSLSFRIYENN